MTGYRTIDLENWARKDHYRYYTEQLPVMFSITSMLDITAFLARCRRDDLRFFPAFTFCISRAVNRTEAFRMFRNKENKLCIWDSVSPNYTVFHPESETFSDVWTEYSDDFPTFYAAMCEDIRNAEGSRNIKAKPGQPDAFFCLSDAPWLSFTSVVTWNCGGAPVFFPVMQAGKYTEDAAGRITIPFSISIAHAVCDAYHASCFYKAAQEELDRFGFC